MSHKINTVNLDTAGDIAMLAEKVTPDSGDLLVIEDSADSNAKKKVQIGNLPTGGGTTLVQRDWSGGAAITTANVVAGGAAVSGNVTGWFDLGTVHRVQFVASSDTRLLTFRLYADAAHTVMLYEALGVDAWTTAYEDLVPFHYRDADGAATLHYLFQNFGLNDSIVTLTIQGIGG